MEDDSTSSRKRKADESLDDQESSKVEDSTQDASIIGGSRKRKADEALDDNTADQDDNIAGADDNTTESTAATDSKASTQPRLVNVAIGYLVRTLDIFLPNRLLYQQKMYHEIRHFFLIPKLLLLCCVCKYTIFG